MSKFSAFKNVESSVLEGLSGSEKLSLGIHNSLLQMGNVSSYTNASLAGAGAGAVYGALNGAFSYDGSILGGAFHGAMLGGVGGAGLKFGANTYAQGAKGLTGAFGKDGTVGSLRSTWTKGAFKDSEGNSLSAFQTSAFKNGWG